MNLNQIYKEKVVPAMLGEMKVSNRLAVPKLTKLVINVGLKEAAHDKGVLEKMSEQIMVISGQKAKVTVAKLSIAGFKVRAGDPVGLTVTLRGKRMYDFLAKLINVVLPRVRDFQGVSAKAFDTNGNYTLGIAEQIVFPEIDYSKIDKVRGFEITLVFKPNTDKKTTKKILELMGMPFEKETKHG
jgi:large subunit ribosomal protein L5